MKEQNLILPKGVLQPPDYFSDNQNKYYKYFFDKVDEKDLVGMIDEQAIVNLSIMADLRDQYNKDISDNGLTFSSDGRNGEQTKPNPSLQLLHAATKSMADRMKEYGLTPKTQGGRTHETREKHAPENYGMEPMKVMTN